MRIELVYPECFDRSLCEGDCHVDENGTCERCATPHGMRISWENGKIVELSDRLKVRPDFWNIIEVVLQDANKEGGIVALRNAEQQAMQTIEAMKKNKKPLIIT